MRRRGVTRLVAVVPLAGAGLAAAQAEALWDSPAYRELVRRREGRMTAEALLFE